MFICSHLNEVTHAMSSRIQSLLPIAVAVLALLANAPQALAGTPERPEPGDRPAATLLQGERISIPGSRAPAPPFEIDTPGSYCLIGDRLCAQDGIRINADDVTIDFMGFTLTGPDSGSSVGIVMDGRRNVEIRGGTIRDFGARGIHDRNQAGTAQGKRITAMRILSNGSCGICLGGDGNVIRDCFVADNRGTGACVGRSIVERNVFLNNTTGGISCGDYSLVLGNVISKTEKTGIFARTGCTIMDNTVCEAGNTGIYGEHGCLIEHNTACENNQTDTPWAYAGIKTLGDCIIRSNIARGNLQNNIYAVRSGNVVEHNLAAAPSDTLGNGYCFRVGFNYFANNKASNNKTNFAGELPTGAGDGGGNIALEHFVPPPPAPSTDSPGSGSPAGGQGGTGR
jgi:hypothetical protein